MAPVFTWLAPAASVSIPEANSDDFSFNVRTPSASVELPSTSLSEASVNSFTLSVSSSRLSASLNPSSANASALPTVKIEPISNSVTSAVIVKLSGISSVSSSVRSRLSVNPGSTAPATICLLASEITFPWSISIFLKCSVGKMPPVSIKNGTHISVCVPFTSTIWRVRFV